MLPEHIAQIAHTATRHYRERDARRLARNAGVSPVQLRMLVRVIDATLTARGALGHREIEAEVSAQLNQSVTIARVALKYAWETGHLVYRNASTSWNKECRMFSLARTSAPQITINGNQGEAAARLIRMYFERYGPATIKDAMWWSGLNRTDIVNALTALGQGVVSIQTPWCDENLYIFEREFEELRYSGDKLGGVDFLAHEDVALKAYYQTRRRYLYDLPPGTAFNQIGEVLPTIVQDGRVVGAWRWNVSNRKVDWNLFTTSQHVRKQSALRADQLTSALRARYSA